MAELILMRERRIEAAQQWARSVRRRSRELREKAEADRGRAVAIRAERRLGVPGRDAEQQRRLRQAESQAVNLQKALASSRRIGMAVGIVMAMRRLTEDQAFAVRRRASNHRNTKLSVVAEELILTGTLVSPEGQARSGGRC
jgi:hypothetical protein